MTHTQTHGIVTGHEDLIHDVAYDYYGRTLATCSSDRHIKVYIKTNNDNWVLYDSWKAHDSSIVKLAWAPPEYGQILASVSYDRTLKLWEHHNDAVSNSGTCYRRLTTISDAQGPLYDVAFAPGYLNAFRVATVGSDYTLRIYEAFKISDLTEWSQIQEERLIPGIKKLSNNLQGNFTINWCQSKFAREKFCVSANDVCSIYIRDANNTYIKDQSLPHHGDLIRDVAWAPSLGRSYELLATASKDGFVKIFKIIDKTLDVYGVSGGVGSGSSLNYNHESSDNNNNGEVTMEDAQSSNYNNNVNNESNEDKYPLEINSLFDGSSNNVAINETNFNANTSIMSSNKTTLNISLVDELYVVDERQHPGLNTLELNNEEVKKLKKLDVWSVSWNSTGTLLSTSIEDGTIKFWKATKRGNYACAATTSVQKKNSDN